MLLTKTAKERAKCLLKLEVVLQVLIRSSFYVVYVERRMTADSRAVNSCYEACGECPLLFGSFKA